MSKKEHFMAYEYKNVTVKRNFAEMYIDCMENFGWTLIENGGYHAQALLSNLNPANLGRNIANTAQSSGKTAGTSAVITLKFKRDREILNKAELTRLQRHFDSGISEIARMEQSNISHASIVAFTIGIIGTAFMAGSVFSYLAGSLILCIVLAVPAFLGWFIPYFAYRSIFLKKNVKIEPLINSKYDEIYDVCEKAHRLLV